MAWGAPFSTAIPCGEPLEWCAHCKAAYTDVRVSCRHRTEPRMHSKLLCSACAAKVLARSDAAANLAPEPEPTPAVAAPTPAAEQVKPRKRIIFPIPPDARVTSCSSCAESIVFIVHPRTGSRMPIEVFGDHAGECHFAYCKKADQHRKRA